MRTAHALVGIFLATYLLLGFSVHFSDDMLVEDPRSPVLQVQDTNVAPPFDLVASPVVGVCTSMAVTFRAGEVKHPFSTKITHLVLIS